MTNAKICDTNPIEVELEEGKDYFFCTCGHSANQPFCDGAHKNTDTGLKSQKFSVETSGRFWLCMCKRTEKTPFCDGTHAMLQIKE